MKVLRIEIDDNTMKRIDKLAPADSRERSAFIREAIQRALWEVEERQTQQAYARRPDSAEDAYFDAGVWERRRRRVPAK
jgi:predicted transcriptional regulator